MRHYLLLLVACAASFLVRAEPFHALTLTEAERLLLANNPDLAMARAGLAGAEAGILAADTAPNPQLSISATGISPRQGIGSGRLFDKQMDSVLRIDHTIERGGKRELRVTSAEAAREAAAKDLASQRRQLRVTLAGTYFDLLAAQRRLSLAREIAADARRSADIAKRRLDAGDLARVDLARALADAVRAEGDADLAEADLRHAQLALAQLIGLGDEARTLVAADDWPPLEIPPERTLPSHPDLEAARARMQAARAARDLAKAQKSRDLGVGIQLERNPSTAPGTLLGFSLSVPLFLGNDYRGDIARAEADYTMALEALRKTEYAVAADLARLRADTLAYARRARRLQEELLPEARRAAAAAEYAFAHGAMAIGDLLDARRTLKAAEQDVIASLADYAKALHAWRLQQEEP